jgi:antitoxin component YwqK of YwqJK toxin-antitoxin module
MKSILLLFIFLLIPVSLFAQGENDKVIYLDSTYQKTDEENHIYYSVIREYHVAKENYKIEEYYKSGILKKVGTSAEKDTYRYFDFLTSYYETGKVEEKTFYTDGQPLGHYLKWYENGAKQTEGEYIKDDAASILKINNFWDESGIQKAKDGNGFYEENDGKVFLSGNIHNGFKHGIWEGFDESLNITFSENYKYGQFISGVSIDVDNTERTYKDIQVRPIPKNGITDFYSFVAKNFKVPEDETANGKIILTFIVDKKGKIKDIEVIRGISDKTDEEAVRVLELYDRWEIAKSRGIDVDARFSLPINIINGERR